MNFNKVVYFTFTFYYLSYVCENKIVHGFLQNAMDDDPTDAWDESKETWVKEIHTEPWNNNGQPKSWQQEIVKDKTSYTNNNCVNINRNCDKCLVSERLNNKTQTINKTFCHLTTTNITVDDILTNLSLDTSALQIIVDYYPTEIPIDLSNISKQINLEIFELKQVTSHVVYAYPLIFHNNTFQNLTKLKILRLNCLTRTNIDNIIQGSTCLEILDLSSTFNLGFDRVKVMLNKTNIKCLQSLLLSAIQLIGGANYDTTLNMEDLLGNRIFPNLLEINIAKNSLIYILPGIYKLVPNLKRYDLSENTILHSINIAALLEACMHPTIQWLNISYQGCAWSSSGLTSNMKDQSRDFLQKIDNPVLLYHSTKTKDNRFLAYSFVVDCVNNIDKINGKSNITKLTSPKLLLEAVKCLLPVALKNFPDNLLPPLTELFNFSCALYIKIPFGANLKTFDYSHMSPFKWLEGSSLAYKITGNICISKNMLTSLMFNENSAWFNSAGDLKYFKQLGTISGWEQVKILDISNNKYSYDIIDLGKSFPEVEDLRINGNNMNMPHDFEVCIYMTKLKKLNLADNNKQGNLSTTVVKNCSNLEELYLSHNGLYSVDLDLNGTYKLALLDYSNNNLNFLTASFLSKVNDIAKSNNKSIRINLSNNMLSCGCTYEALYFIKMMITAHFDNILFINFENYICTSRSKIIPISNITLSDLNIMYNQCFPSPVKTIVVTVLSMLAVMLIFSLGSLIYIYRWRINYMIFKIQNFYCKSLNTHTEEQNWKYDAFVAYCAEDRFWVHDVLMKTLERLYSFKLCIHYRDFPVGEPIAETIINKMMQSRELIIVISNTSLKQEWCQFEIDQAILQTDRRRKRVIVIKLGQVENLREYQTASHLMDTHTYLEWTDDPRRTKLFWAKLVGKLYGDNTGHCVVCCPYGSKAIQYNEIHDSDEINQD